MALSHETKLPCESILEILFGFKLHIDDPVGVISHPSSMRADILPELPIVNPLSNNDFANLHIESRIAVSVIYFPILIATRS